MNDNLKKLINNINLEDKYYPFFDDSKLKRIISNKEKTNYTFIIEIPNTLPVDLYQHFTKLVKDKYSDIEKVIVVFDVVNQDNDLVKEYFKYLMQKAAVKCPVLSTFIDNNVYIDNKLLVIEVDNIAEQNKLLSIEKTIVLNFKRMGYDITGILTKIVEHESIIEEIDSIEIPKERLIKVEETPVEDKKDFF